MRTAVWLLLVLVSTAWCKPSGESPENSTEGNGTSTETKSEEQKEEKEVSSTETIKKPEEATGTSAETGDSEKAEVSTEKETSILEPEGARETELILQDENIEDNSKEGYQRLEEAVEASENESNGEKVPEVTLPGFINPAWFGVPWFPASVGIASAQYPAIFGQHPVIGHHPTVGHHPVLAQHPTVGQHGVEGQHSSGTQNSGHKHPIWQGLQGYPIISGASSYRYDYNSVPSVPWINSLYGGARGWNGLNEVDRIQGQVPWARPVVRAPSEGLAPSVRGVAPWNYKEYPSYVPKLQETAPRYVVYNH